MSKRSLFALSVLLVVASSALKAQETGPTPEDNPTGNAGALKAQIQTGGSYDAHSGNGTRIVNDLKVPGALGVYGLDFTRYWNSTRNYYDDPEIEQPGDFGDSGWTHSWRWSAGFEDIYPPPPIENDSDANPSLVYVTALNILFPDGHTGRYKISRVKIGHWQVDPNNFTAPFTESEVSGFTNGGRGVHDHVKMSPGGTEFWLCRADGGSVHFLLENGGFLAKEVYDPHGFKTTLSYTNGYLTRVEQEGGRFLNITWGQAGAMFAITRVDSGNATGGTQTVYYYYASSGTLQRVVYDNEKGPASGMPAGENVTAVYNYGNCWGNEPAPPASAVCTEAGTFSPPGELLLKRADDPHYAGAMTTIRYNYRGGEACPKLERLPGTPLQYPNYFNAQTYAIAAEKSDTGMGVSGFLIGDYFGDCLSGKRKESNGLGNSRKFYFGTSAPPNNAGVFNHGYELGKLDDFARTFFTAPPSERQHFGGHGHPDQIWDGLDHMTQAVYGDDSGEPTEIHRVDGSVEYFNRVNPGASDAIDPSQGMHNTYNHWLFSHTDQLNRTTTYTRDARRRVRRIDYYGGSYEEFAYNSFNQVTLHTLPSGKNVHYEYDPYHRLVSEWNDVDGQTNDIRYTYDSLDRVATVSHPWSRAKAAVFSVALTYNGRHQVVREEYPATDSSGNSFKQYGYDKWGDCMTITDELGHTSTYTYDLYHRCVSYTEPLNAPDWKGNGNPGVAGRTWTWEYDRYVHTSTVGVDDHYDASAHTSKQWWRQYEPPYNADGYRQVTARFFDENDRIIEEYTGMVDRPNLGLTATVDTEVHRFTYDENGQKKTYTDPRQRVTTYVYDNRNRLWQTIEPLNRVTETLYDMAGNKTDVTFPDTKSQHWRDYDAFGQAGRFIDERNQTTNFTYQWGPMKKLWTVITHRSKDTGGTEDQPTTFYYDGMGRPQTTVFPDASEEWHLYEFGQVHNFVTRKGQWKTISYDARGREISHTWSDQTLGIDRVWDKANRLTSIANLNSTIGFVYDDAGQVRFEDNTIAGSDGTRRTEYYRYPNGSVAHFKFPYGFMIRKDYTARGQLQTVGWDDANGTWLNRLVDYYYHPDGKVNYQTYGNALSRTDFGYDGRGMINSVRHYKPGTNPPTTAQNLAERNYGRDERDRITWWKRGTDNSLNGKETGVGDKFVYDSEGQLTDAWYLAHIDGSGNASNWLAEEHFQYDQLGNRFGQNQTLSHGTVNFTRKDNGLNQYRAWMPYSITNYDDDIGPPWATPTSHQANGVLMQDGNVTAGYNALNQAVMINTTAMGSNWTFFGYDPLGRCVKRWTGGLNYTRPFPWIPPENSNPATYFYYDGWNLVQEGPSGLSPTRVYAHGARVDEIIARSIQGSGLAFHHYDAQGNCILLSDSVTGNIIEQYDFEAFGKPYIYDAAGYNITNTAPLPWNNRFLFTGREYLSDLKLYEYRNRMYQPELGRFMQPDPKEFAAGDYNLYRYCHNDPVNHSDPTGLELDAVYSISNQTLVVVNRDNGERMTVSASSGTNRLSDIGSRDRGPVPMGSYSIYNRGPDSSGASRYILEPNDNRPNNDTLDGRSSKEGGGRYAFRIHVESPNAPQKGSEGCVVMGRDNLSKVDKMASDTSKGPKATIISEGKKRGEQTDVFRDRERIGTLKVGK